MLVSNRAGLEVKESGFGVVFQAIRALKAFVCGLRYCWERNFKIENALVGRCPPWRIAGGVDNGLRPSTRLYGLRLLVGQRGTDPLLEIVELIGREFQYVSFCMMKHAGRAGMLDAMRGKLPPLEILA